MRSKSRFWSAAVLAAGLAAAGCRSMMADYVQEVPVTNWLPLHEDVRPGDYAVYESFNGRQRMRVEAASVKDGLVEVVATWPRPPAAARFLKGFEYHLRVAEDGTVREAFLRDRRGQDRPLRVAGFGDPNYVANRRAAKLPSPERVETPAGAFEVREIVAFEQSMINSMAAMEMTSVYYLHPDAKFGLVRQQHAARAEISLAELLQYVDSVIPAAAGATWLTDWLIKKSTGGREAVNGMNLVEQG